VRILSTIGLPATSLERIRSVVPSAEVIQLAEPADWQPAVLDTDIWLAHVAQVCSAPALGARLRWVQLSSAGAEALFASPRIHAPILYTNASGVQSVGMAEYVLSVLSCFTRQIPELLSLQRAHHWPVPAEIFDHLMADELRGMTLGLVGYGSINSAVAHLAHAFGMHILACKRDPSEHRVPRWNPAGAGDPDGALPERWYGPAQITEMLALSDYVVAACPLTAETAGMIGAKALQAMPRHAILINVGRGGLVQEAALVEALREGEIAGAVLDVVQGEPLPASSALYDLPHVIITPHISSATKKYYQRMTEVFVENLRRDATGEALYNVLNRDKGY